MHQANRGRRPSRPAAARPATLDSAERGDGHLLRAVAAARAEVAYDAAAACDSCHTVRSAQADPDALCDRHLGQALGISGGWDLGPPGKKL